ncbi:MAG: hypothetical protein HY282_11090 [Nitrospirae bacterium]|nr:hypothetical protein [Candidatus Manganitrophaceae bacterium]
MILKQMAFKTALMSMTLLYLGTTQATAEEFPSNTSSPAMAEEPASLLPPPSEESASDSVSKRSDFWSSLSYGMVARELKADGKIVGSKDRKLMLSEGDTVYLVLSQELPPSQKEWVVFKKTKSVYHPKTGKFVGDLIEINGIVRITGKQDQTVIARVTHSKGPIEINDEIVSFETLRSPSPSPEGTSSGKNEALIVEVTEDQLNNAEHSIVYIDRGRRDGLLPGDQFQVIHGGQESGFPLPGERARLPKRTAGRLLILSTQEQTATARIIESSETLSKGDPLLYLPTE